VKARLLRREDLSADEGERLLVLLTESFDGVSRAGFERDLAEKNWVLLLEEGGRIKGFSTLLVYDVADAGEALRIVYSGDTIVQRDAWGSLALARGWIGAVQELSAGWRGRVFWLLITSGFRTYRFLPVFWRDFHPRFDSIHDHEGAARLSRIAGARFGDRFAPDLGIVRLADPQRLGQDLVEIPDAKRADPHVLFFLARNPGWAQGDELVCLTELADTNLTPAGRRMWEAARRERQVTLCP
jgi:hypothetical protein